LPTYQHRPHDNSYGTLYLAVSRLRSSDSATIDLPLVSSDQTCGHPELCVQGEWQSRKSLPLEVIANQVPPSMTEHRAGAGLRGSLGFPDRSASTSTGYVNTNLIFTPHECVLTDFEYLLSSLAAHASLEVYRAPKQYDQTLARSRQHPGSRHATITKYNTTGYTVYVVALRGSSFCIRDCSTNFQTSPDEADGFLDDGGNACHSGFLHSARAMTGPIADLLHAYCHEDEGKTDESCTLPRLLLLTGHSAGGAVAALLHAHMLSAHVSPLSSFTPYFGRICCVTFGAPPSTLLPLGQHRPDTGHLIISLINDGDPVPRMDGATYVRSILHLKARTAMRPGHQGSPGHGKGVWKVPPSRFVVAGRAIILHTERRRGRWIVETAEIGHDLLQELAWADMGRHSMAVYKDHVDLLGRV